MIKRIDVNTSMPYKVIVGSDVFNEIKEEFLAAIKGERLVVVTDSGVPKGCIDKIKGVLADRKFQVSVYVFNEGEQSKNADTLFKILSFFANCGLTRKDTVIACGGGVVGDITGLAASLYMRGINYVQVPTTLLSQIDSSVGGKTAIDLLEGKNLVGTFYQPSLVVCDVSFLDSLSKDNLLCGLGEGIKYAFLIGGEFYNNFISNVSKNEITCDKGYLCGLDLVNFVADCVSYKAKIVSQDEKERGARSFLNLGHTFGHAIEKLSGYTIPHGVCVAEGLDLLFNVFKDKISAEMQADLDKIIKNLSIDLTDNFENRELLKAMRLDKKSSGDDINFAFITEPGKPYTQKISFLELEERL